MKDLLRLSLAACLLLMGLTLTAQTSSNMSLLGQFDDGLTYNDIWGYATGGREYALMGSLNEIHFLEVTDPTNIVEVASISATTGSNSSSWRDIKTYGTYAYSVADQSTTSEGLMIFDLSNINGVGTAGGGAPRVTLLGQLRNNFTRAHNIFIDEPNGILYVVGANVGGADIIVYDLNPDPANPVLVDNVSFPAGYIHDVYVENHIAYCSHLTDGLYVYDMSPLTNPGLNPPAAPVELGVIDGYPYQVFNHSSWVSGNYIVFADEKHGSPLKIADITDVNDAQIEDEFFSNLLNLSNPYSPSSPRGPIAHNPFILGNYCYVSYYHDGVAIFDISDPTNVVKVGYYDTYLGNTNYNGYQGCWGVYPFLPSGNIIASDISTGLYVLDFSAPLPVEWESFTAKAEGKGVRLDWSTSSQSENAGFRIQRQIEKDAWEDLGWEDANEEQRYRFWDDNPRGGWNVYRLMQRDFDGTESSSEWKSAFVEVKAEEWQAYPNPLPAGEKLFLSGGSSSSANWQLFDATGRSVWEGQSATVQGQSELSFPLLPAGVYWLRQAGADTALRLVVE